MCSIVCSLDCCRITAALSCQVKRGILSERQQLSLNSYSVAMSNEKTLAEFKLHSESTVRVKVVRSAADFAHARSHPTPLKLFVQPMIGQCDWHAFECPQRMSSHLAAAVSSCLCSVCRQAHFARCAEQQQHRKHQGTH